ncbi:MAG TPA: hypothetical protein ENI62_06655, partial [Gammaproteobacteria bacterium]|nr:hypothetical protein [Gammaproteobacteria bacterium]
MKTTTLRSRRLSQFTAIASAMVLAGCATAGTTAGGKNVAKAPMVGLGAYTQSHAKNPTPPRRLGGPVTVTAS